jgi:hypothetical protein
MTEKLSVWQSAAAFGGQKLQKAETNRGEVSGAIVGDMYLGYTSPYEK